ncbi:helix-turn-helix transcriptional regulator, partial [Saccharibacillus sp. WB 17]
AELAAARGAWLWAEWLPGGRLGLLLRLPVQPRQRSPGEAPDAVGAASAIAEELIAWIAAHLHCTVTVALGGAFDSPAGIARGFREAVEAIGYKSSLGGARVLVGRDLHRGAAADLYGVLRTIRELARAYRLGEPQWRDRLEELLGGLRAAPLPKDDLSGLMNVLAYQLLREMMELPGEAKELWHGEAAPRLGAALEHFDTLDELETSVRSLLSEYAVRLKLLRESRSSHVTLQEVRAFIDANYIDPDLSLSSIADRFGLSASYLSRLFKDAFGQNFVDYLAGIRVEAAQALLRDTEDPIREIATRVGYANYMSFSRAFKKIVSATPGEYRIRSRAT